jgi:hypothetical protein
MDATWEMLFLAGKWMFLGLLYLFFFIILWSVRREMQTRLDVSPAVAVAPGRLRVLQNGSDGRLRPGMVLVLGNQATLGVDPANDLVLTDQYLSAQHARLRWDGVQWWVEDLASKNGTFVNGRACPPHRPQLFPFGGQLEMGGMVFELLGEG